MKNFSLNLVFLTSLVTNGFCQSGITSYPLPVTTPVNLVYQRNCLKIDASGNKWVGFQKAGLGKFDGTAWTMFDTLNSGIPSNQVSDVAFGASTTIWAATNKGVAKYDGSLWTKYNTANSGLPNDTATCVYVNNSDAWIGTRNGLAKLNGSTWTVYNTSNSGLTTNRMQCITAASNNDVFVGTNTGLYKKSGSTWTNYGTLNPYLTAKYSILSIYIDTNNDKWIGTDYGVFKLQGNNLTPISSLFPNYAINCNGQNYNIYSITKGPQGGVAFMNNDGLVEITGNQVYKYLGVGGDLLAYDTSSGLIGYLKKMGAPNLLYSFNYQNYTGVSLQSPIKEANTLDINEVRAEILDHGDMFWGLFCSQGGGYEVPKNSGRNANFASALWIGAIDNGGQLHEAAMTYRQDGNDYWPGPLDTISGTIDSATSDAYDKIWKINRFKVEEFKYNFSLGTVQSGAYTVDNDILTWPAIGAGNFTRNLAPFIDVNHDGLYKPLIDGDYPDIKGDQMCYWIFNDNLSNIHTCSFGIPFKLEVHASAYAYTCSTITDSLKALNYTTFYNYKIFNRSTQNYHSSYMGMWEDADLGWYLDDYVGCNPANNYGYEYNATPVDGAGTSYPFAYGAKPPMLSTVILNGPLAEPNDSIDNNNNGIIDEPGEKNLMTNFNCFGNSNDTVSGNPHPVDDFYQYLTSHWRNGTHVTYGGNGTTGTIPTNFMFDGVPSGTGWDEVSLGDALNDRRFVISSGPFNFNAGSSVDYDYAIVFTRDTASAYSIQNLYQKNKEDVNKIKQWFAVDSFPSCLDVHIGIADVKPVGKELIIYPNPANTTVTINFKTTSKNYSIKIYDITGRVVKSIEHTNSLINTINISDLEGGVYLINLVDDKTSLTKRFVKQ